MRNGAFLFGLGSLVYHLLEFISHFVIHLDDKHKECRDSAGIAISAFSIVFIILQSIAIIFFPRLKIHYSGGLAHFGLMHVVATNMVIWMRTVIKESLHGFHEVSQHEEKHTEHEEEKEYSSLYEKCLDKYHAEDFVTKVLKTTSPYLMAFIIEFSLVGCTVFYNTWSSVHIQNSVDPVAVKKQRKESRVNPEATMAKINWGNSARGAMVGCIVLFLTTIEIMIFLGVDGLENWTKEQMGKILNCLINTVAGCAAVIGLVQIQKLKEKTNHADHSVDLFLLDLGVFFVYIYSCLTIIVGIYGKNEDIPGGILTADGVLTMLTATCQIILSHQILQKSISSENSPLWGRQAVTCLAFFNFSLWLYDTFELQKSQASLVESKFYGDFTWVWLQRVTLPVCIFFRFHSTVIMADSWKNSYRYEGLPALSTLRRLASTEGPDQETELAAGTNGVDSV